MDIPGSSPTTPVRLGSLFHLHPRVNLAARLHSQPGHTWGPRTISDSQLIYVNAGRMRVQLGPTALELKRGECVFYGADSPHLIVSAMEDPVEFISIHFDWTAEEPHPVHPISGICDCSAAQLSRSPIGHTIVLDGLGEVDFPHASSVPDLEEAFAEIVKEFDARTPGHYASMSGRLKLVLAGIARKSALPRLSSEARAKIQVALDAMRARPTRNWRVDELASMCGFHPTYFAELFRKGTGMSPKRFAVLERIAFAKALLLGGAESIESVSERAGFRSVQYFCRVFRGETGLTPLQYRHHRTAI